jgi:hypothetical protein
MTRGVKIISGYLGVAYNNDGGCYGILYCPGNL